MGNCFGLEGHLTGFDELLRAICMHMHRCFMAQAHPCTPAKSEHWLRATMLSYPTVRAPSTCGVLMAGRDNVEACGWEISPPSTSCSVWEMESDPVSPGLDFISQAPARHWAGPPPPSPHPRGLHRGWRSCLLAETMARVQLAHSLPSSATSFILQ